MKHELYFSNYCKFSKEVLLFIENINNKDDIIVINIDKRFKKNNTTYIKVNNNKNITLPPMITRVPVLLIKPSHEILVGNQIMEYFKTNKPEKKEQQTIISNDPDPFDLNTDTLNKTGVNTDTFSFLDMNEKDLNLEGNGGMRQLYNYQTLDEPIKQINIEDFNDGDRKKKLDVSLEDIQSKRQNELN